MSERYTIGEAAKKLQVSTRTLRFYEEKDLVRPAYTEENGYRFYEKDQIRQLELILFLKELGFSLKQIKMLIQDEHGSQSLELLLKEQYQGVHGYFNSERNKKIRNNYRVADFIKFFIERPQSFERIRFGIVFHDIGAVIFFQIFLLTDKIIFVFAVIEVV